MIKKQLNLQGMHCVSCSLLIEGELSDIGVDATCDYKKQILDVSFDGKKHTLDEVIAVVKRLGYGVTEISEMT